MLYLDDYFACAPALFGPRPNIVEVGIFEPAGRLAFRAHHPAWRLYFVEASPTNYQTLLSRLPPLDYSVQTLRAALADSDGETTLYEFHHAQLSTLFPRHVQEGVTLHHSMRVRGLTLGSLLDALRVPTCDLLLLICEGAEIFAMRQLADEPALRARVKQFCTSSHCEHIRCYPRQQWQDLTNALAPHYDATRARFPHIPYFLFTTRGAQALPERGATALRRKP